MRLRGIYVATLAGLMVACAAKQPMESAMSAAQRQAPLAPAAPPAAAEPAPPTASGRTPREEIVERGSGSFVREAPLRATAAAAGGDIDLRFDAVDIKEFAGVVLGDLLGVNYSIDADVSGAVTIHTAMPIAASELMPLFEELLAVNNAVLIRSGGFYRVATRATAARSAAGVTVANNAAGAGFTTQVIPLEYIAAQEMQTILEKVVADPSSVRIDSARNVVIASGTTDELQTVLDTIAVFDVDWLRGMSVGLYPLDNVQPGTMETELIQVLNATTGGVTEELLGGIVRLVPLDRLSSLLVVSSTPTALREMELWIRRLDQPGESTGRRLYVYPMQNAKASDLADILGNIFGSRARSDGGVEPVASAGGRVTTLAPGLQAAQIGGSRTPSAADDLPTAQQALTAAGAASGGRGDVEITGNEAIEIIADDVRNALVILASPQDYLMVEAALAKLDVVPLQVLIEASILEVTLRDDLSFGVEWFFRNSINGNENTGTGLLDSGSPGIAALAPGFSYTVVNNANQVRLALNTLASESELNVLSSPSLMVLDNQTATINVGDEIPVPTRQSISNLDPSSPTVNEISFRQTGVTLSVTPRVSNSGLVTMDIRQEVASAAATTTSNIDAPTIQNRQIESVVAVNSGETIVLGGLMQDQNSNGESGVPGLRKIPGLGKLFGRTVKEHGRTELLVLITPRVVRTQDDARRVTEEFRRKLPQLRSIGTSESASSSEPSS